MTNGEYITKLVEQDEDFCILMDDVAETVTIEVSRDWWDTNTLKVDELNKIREDIFDEIKNRYTEVRDKSMTKWCSGKVSGLKRALEIIDKYKYKAIIAEIAEYGERLDNIRAEILKLDDINPDYLMDKTIHISRNEVLGIIDKYR